MRQIARRRKPPRALVAALRQLVQLVPVIPIALGTLIKSEKVTYHSDTLSATLLLPARSVRPTQYLPLRLPKLVRRTQPVPQGAQLLSLLRRPLLM